MPHRSSNLAKALKRRFRTPQEALQLLGIDPALLAQDEASSPEKRIFAFLQSRLSPDDVEQLKTLFRAATSAGAETEAEDDEDMTDLDKGVPVDRSLPEQRQRESRRSWDQDSRIDRIPVPGGGKKQAEDRRRMASDSSSFDSYASRWPEAARIKVLG